MWKEKKKRERSESEEQRENCIGISHCSRVMTEALSLLRSYPRLLKDNWIRNANFC